MTRTEVKRALFTGAGSLYLQSMTNEPTTTTAPIYAEEVYVTPSLDKMSAQLELAEKTIRLSNLVHREAARVTKVDITVDAGYFPEGFAEKHSGMVQVGGGWSMPSNPKKLPFRYAQPLTDEDGKEYIINYPYCFLSPIDVEGETEKDDINEKIRQYKVTALILPTEVTVSGKKSRFVYHTMDMAKKENEDKYDRDKLLEKGWYDDATAEACVK